MQGLGVPTPGAVKNPHTAISASKNKGIDK